MARTSAAAYRRRPRSSSWSRNAAYRSSMARSSIIRPYIEATNALGTPSADPTQLPNQSWLFLRVALLQEGPLYEEGSIHKIGYKRIGQGYRYRADATD